MNNDREQIGFKKAALLQEIQQQRLELSRASQEWLDTTATLDRRWTMLIGLRKYAVVGIAIVAVIGLRKPARLLKWSRKLVGLWGATRLARRIYNDVK